MRKSFLTMLLLILITPFTVLSQNTNPVYEVVATENENAVDLIWSGSDIIPESIEVDFETGDFSQADFYIDPTFPWIITEDAYEGDYAIKSSCEGEDNGVSAIEITVDVPYDATMSFWHKVDCEYYFDNARFFIDGVERSLITGDIDWEYKEFEVTKGVHTYRWTYRKDSDDYVTSTDAYFLDNIVLYKKHEPFAGGWIKYDDGNYKNALGSESGFIEWGVCFPNTEEYAGYNLTKMALYAQNAATVKANIYFGGVDAPAAIVSSEEFYMPSSKKIYEYELKTPVPLDGTEPLWITFSSTDPTFVATFCNYVGNPNSDWVDFGDGKGWQHLSKMDGGAYKYSWIVRGFLENSRGEVAVLNNDTRASENYDVYRKNLFTGEEKLIAENVTDTVYTDAAWSELEYAPYQWGVAAADNEIVWSNVVDKDMFTTVNLNVTTNSIDNVYDARVKFVNITEPEQGYDYKAVLDETGEYTFKKFRKGTYNYTVELLGFETYSQENIVINEETELECVLTEIKAAVENLYVSPTGWAKWDKKDFSNGGGSFFFDFEDGLLDGWTTIDADGDGFTWRSTTEIMGPGYGYKGSKYCVISQSYCVDTIGELSPDNYFITADKYLITEDSKLSYYVCVQDEQSPAEHYAVLVSTESNTDVTTFETVWEETMSRSTRNSRGQGAWYKREIDLKKYAGQEVYIAFRHFNTIGQFYIDIDNIALDNYARSSRNLTGYTVKLNDEVVASNIKTNYYQFEDVKVGETYKATVIANYTTGDSQAAEYNWTCVSSEDYAGATSFKGKNVAGEAFLQWTLEGDTVQEEVESDFFFNFNDGTLDGWRNIDADGDGYVWYNSAEKLGPGYGYKDSTYCIVSHSFYSGQFNFSLTPDNYLVTEKKYLITENSQLSFMVCAQDPSYYKEHYGVAISLFDNATADDFVTIWEETIESDDTDYETPQTPWTLRTVDLSKYAGEEVYIALRHFNCEDQYMIDIDDVALTSGTKSSRNEKEVLGVMVYCEGELLTEDPITNRGYNAEFPGSDEYEYCIRVVYSDYGMSAPQCIVIDAPMQCDAPRNLYGEATINENGDYGVSLSWPFDFSDWLYYDNDNPSTGFSYNGQPYYTAILFPADMLADYAGTSITKIKLYDYEVGSASILIYYGSTARPVIPAHIQSVTYTGAKQWVEIDLEKSVPITGEDHVWVMVYQTGTAILCEDNGNQSNGRWISMNGSEWADLKTLNSAYNYVWAIRAFVTSMVDTDRAASELQEVELAINNDESQSEPKVFPIDDVVATDSRVSPFQHYNVYRGTDLNEMTVVATPTEGKYFETLTNGTYYYQVTATYKDGDETCESGPANSFREPDQNYVKVEVLGLEDNSVNGVIIYPNPTKGNLTINAEALSRITIINTLGQVVYDNNATSDNEVVNMSQFDNGLYIVRIATETGVVTRRVSVVR